MMFGLNIDFDVVYILGFSTLALSLIEDLSSKNKNKKPLKYYLTEFAYTSLSILTGIFACEGFELSKGWSVIISVLLGLTGSSIIRKIKSNKEKISNAVLDKTISKIDDGVEQTKIEEYED